MESKKETVKFLDYVIVNCRNQDGWVLKKEDKYDYECHLGNYSCLHSAMEAAVIFFMIARPEKFGVQVFHRAIGSGTWGEYYTFAEVCKNEDIDLPIEIQCSKDGNCILDFQPCISGYEIDKDYVHKRFLK